MMLTFKIAIHIAIYILS